MNQILTFVCVLIFSALNSCQLLHGQSRTLRILHTNDIHGGFLPREAVWINTTPRPMIGGFKELWWTVDSIRKASGEVLLLDGGDLMTGTPISDFEYKGALGGALAELMNFVGYDAWTIGNHELDISQSNLKNLAALMKSHVVGANLVDTAGRFLFSNKEYAIVHKAGLRIGIIGLISTDLFLLTNTNNLGGLKVLPPVETTQRIIDEIDEKTDLIIALTHQGLEEDSILAVKTRGLDVIVGGHSHTRLKTPKRINGVVIGQAGSNCENLGVIEIVVEKDSVVSFNGQLIQLWARHDVPENALTRFVDQFKSKVDEEYDQVIGTLTTDWKRGRGESNIGNFVVDALLEAANADISVTNSSGIRKDLNAGPIKKMDLFEIIPFRNTVCTFPISGGAIRELAERHVRGLLDRTSSIQIGGLNCHWKSADGGPVIESLTIKGVPVENDRIYVCATSDFVVNQADKYLGLAPESVGYTHHSVLQALVEKVQRDKIINSKIENRFQQIQ